MPLQHVTKPAKLKRVTLSSQWMLSYLMVGVWVCTSTLKNYLVVSPKTKYMPTWRPTVNYIPKENEYIRLSKDIYKNVDSSFIHNGQKLETVQIAVSRRIDEETVVYSHVETLHINLKKEWTTDTQKVFNSLNLIVLCERSYKRVPIVYTHRRTCCFIPCGWSSWTGKANQWWKKSQPHNSGYLWGWGWVAQWISWSTRNVFKCFISWDEWCLQRYTYIEIHRPVHFRVHYTLCIFYFSKKVKDKFIFVLYNLELANVNKMDS